MSVQRILSLALYGLNCRAATQWHARTAWMHDNAIHDLAPPCWSELPINSTNYFFHTIKILSNLAHPINHTVSGKPVKSPTIHACAYKRSCTQAHTPPTKAKPNKHKHTVKNSQTLIQYTLFSIGSLGLGKGTELPPGIYEFLWIDEGSRSFVRESIENQNADDHRVPAQ